MCAVVVLVCKIHYPQAEKFIPLSVFLPTSCILHPSQEKKCDKKYLCWLGPSLRDLQSIHIQFISWDKRYQYTSIPIDSNFTAWSMHAVLSRAIHSITVKM